MRRGLTVLVLLALVLAGCGGGGHRGLPTRALVPPVHRCDSKDFVMQCASPTPDQQRRQLGALPPTVAYGVDFAWGQVSAGRARTLGFKFACSYYSWDFSKNWTRSLVAAYHAAGLSTCGVWETTANRALGGSAAGVADAKQAIVEASQVGEPASRPIYFAVDFDTTFTSCSQLCPYFRGVRSVLGARTGAYGGVSTMRTLFNNGLISWGWQTSAWSYGNWDSRAVIDQIGYTNAYDTDRATRADYGQWPYRAPKPPPVCGAACRKRRALAVAEARHARLHLLRRRNHCATSRARSQTCAVWLSEIAVEHRVIRQLGGKL